MQAITIAIGQKGIAYFSQQFVAGPATRALAGLRPPDRTLSVPDFVTFGGGCSDSFSNIQIQLSQGQLSGFNPVFNSITQQPKGHFQLQMSASNFSANYAWYESYYDTFCSRSICSPSNGADNFNYRPGVGSLTTTVPISFVYDPSSKSYNVDVLGTPTATTSGMHANIPGNSVIQSEDTGCFSAHVSDATAASVSAIDFSTPIASLFGSLLTSIPASGHLTPDITYNFALGDSGLTFPGDAGIAIGVTGTVSYKGEQYPGQAPPPLAVPPAPTDDHHLQVYVSNYEVNALHWAYFQAGLLNVTVQPSDLTDPDVLKVKTYVTMIPAFKPYAAFSMQALVAPKQAPVVAFQQVWVFTTAAMNLLQAQLPANIYSLISGLSGNGYVAVTDLESDLSAAGVNASYYPAIENATKAMGMVVTQNLEFTLTIENHQTPAPNVVFDVSRTDILQGLLLGVTGANAQSLQFGFLPVKSTATFVSTTVPHFDRQDFGSVIWPVSGEPRYDEALAALGKTGVPIPIISGFQFVFAQAQVSIQQGYVSVLAHVTAK